MSEREMLADAVTKARDAFREYAELHRKKLGPVAMAEGAHSPEYFAVREKVRRNEALAEEMDAALNTRPPAVAQGDREAVEAAARALYECERARSNHVDKLLAAASGKPLRYRMEHWDDVADLYRDDARAVLAALRPPAVAQGEGVERLDDLIFEFWTEHGSLDEWPGSIAIAEWLAPRLAASSGEPVAQGEGVDLEAAAQRIFARPNFGYWEPGSKPQWVPNGNSHMQELARDLARAALAASSGEPKP